MATTFEKLKERERLLRMKAAAERIKQNPEVQFDEGGPTPQATNAEAKPVGGAETSRASGQASAEEYLKKNRLKSFLSGAARKLNPRTALETASEGLKSGAGKTNAALQGLYGLGDFLSDPSLRRVPEIALETVGGILGGTAGGAVAGPIVGGTAGAVGGRALGSKIADVVGSAGEALGERLFPEATGFGPQRGKSISTSPLAGTADAEKTRKFDEAVKAAKAARTQGYDEAVQAAKAAKSTKTAEQGPTFPTQGVEVQTPYGTVLARSPEQVARTQSIPYANDYLDRIETLRKNRAAAITQNPELEKKYRSIIDQPSVVSPEYTGKRNPDELSDWFKAKQASFVPMTATLEPMTGIAAKGMDRAIRQQDAAARQAAIDRGLRGAAVPGMTSSQGRQAIIGANIAAANRSAQQAQEGAEQFRANSKLLEDFNKIVERANEKTNLVDDEEERKKAARIL